MDKMVVFSDKVTIIEVPFEDRKGEWVTLAADRSRFQRRIDDAARILNPILKSHIARLKEQGNMTKASSFFPTWAQIILLSSMCDYQVLVAVKK
jgi:hypothetical protein